MFCEECGNDTMNLDGSCPRCKKAKDSKSALLAVNCPFCGSDIDSSTISGTTCFHCYTCGADTRFTIPGLTIDEQLNRYKQRAG